MDKEILKDTIKQLFADNKGLLAMDESNPTCNKDLQRQEFHRPLK